jgi:predicted ester cyclase
MFHHTPRPKDLWTPWAELWNGNLSLADKIISPDFVAHFAPMNPTATDVRGPDGIKQMISALLAGFAEAGFTTEVGPIGEDHFVAGRWRFRGVYQGGMPGSAAEAIGKQVEFAGIDIFRVDHDKIVEYWLCSDTLQLLQQVGVIPS